MPITAGNTVYYGSSSTYWAVPPYLSPGNSASTPSVATLAYTLLADVQYSVQPDGSVLLTSPVGTDTLVAFDKINLTNATITINASGSATATLKPGCTDTGAQVNWKDQTTGLTSSNNLAFSSNSSLGYLDWQYLSPSNDTTSISTQADNVFIRGGSGMDAIQVSGGTYVLDGGKGSNFLVGTPGTDSGSDTFFTDGRGSGVVWNTLVNFHAGNSATLWGFVPSVSTWRWDGVAGAAGYTGATPRADMDGSGTVDASVTFAGMAMAQAQRLQVSTGTVGGVP